ncbi:MAG: peptidoglycan-binding domain-containing protein [Eggerthellaceae bacterium]|jgi:hypothetical protein
MQSIKLHDQGAQVEDVQQRLASLGLLDENDVDGAFGERTLEAVREFRKQADLDPGDEVSDKVWSALVDATYHLGDRTLYLRMPYFHGNDVLELQHALGALGFASKMTDGIFGAYTETALRKFQLNMGLPSDGIAGAATYQALRNLHHSWEGKEAMATPLNMGFARAADVLENNAICLFGTQEFTRSVASRMSNLALATNPASKIVSANSLLVSPSEEMLMVHIVLPEEKTAENTPRVLYDESETLALRLQTALSVVRGKKEARIAVELPSTMWEDAGEDRSAQHFAISLLDALCLALSQQLS